MKVLSSATRKVILGMFVFMLITSMIAPGSFTEVKANEQQDQSEEPYIDPNIQAASTDQVDIIVELSAEPIAAKKSEAEENNVMFQSASVEQELETEAEAFISFLDEQQLDYEEIHRYEEVFNGFSLTLSEEDVASLEHFESTKGIYLDQIYEITTEEIVDANASSEHTASLGVDELWEQGLTGAGVKIGVIDTGIDYEHPDLKDAYKGGANFVNDGRQTPLEGYDFVTSTHGTNVSGIIAGNGRVKGVAYDADLYVYRALDIDNRGKTGHILKGIEQATKDDMDILNLSLGRNENESDTPLTRGINNAVKNGTVVVVSSGNEGRSGAKSIGDPGTAALAITVGASHNVNGQESIAPFSSRGPVHETYDIKPDLVAPGVSIYSTSSLAKTSPANYNHAYNYYSGTSMSAPFITGMAALLLEENRERTPAEIKARLMNTAMEVPGYSVNDTGSGRVQGEQASTTPVFATFTDVNDYLNEGKVNQLHHETGSLNFGQVTMGGDFRETRSMQVTNTSAASVDYQMSWDVHGPGESVSLDMPESITVEGNQVTEIPVSLVSTDVTEAGYYEGFILLESDQHPSLRIPFGVEVDVASNPIETLSIEPSIFNEDRNETIVHFQGNGQATSSKLELLDKETGAALGLIHEEQGGPEASSFSWDLTYTSDANEQQEKITDGDYVIQYTVYTSPAQSFSKQAAFMVYSETPEISIHETEVASNDISGQVASYFADIGEAAEGIQGNYSLANETGTYRTGSLRFSDDGQFSLRDKLRIGESTLTIEATDKAGNQASVDFTIIFTDSSYQLGDESQGVKRLKERMAELGFDPDEQPDEFFGEKTEAMLVELQNYYSIPATGIADDETKNKMAEILSTVFKDRNEDDRIVELKQRITGLGFGNFPENPSNVYGRVTANVVKEFQSYYDLRENGIVDEVTLAVIDDLWERSLKDGDDKGEVTELKQNLSALGFGNFPTNPSPRYGRVTSGVVSDFQEHYGLHVSGTANPITLTKISELMSDVYEDGDDLPEIADFKQKLTMLGYGNFPANPSPRYGPVTSNVVKEFQADQGLDVTGTADRLTRAKMDELLVVVYDNRDDAGGIQTLKQQLTFLGFGNFPETPSTRYGPVTARVVEDFQAYYGLGVTGVVNVQTLNILEKNVQTPFQNNESNAKIRELKIQLTSLGFGNFPANPSENYGPVTAAVVKEFQRSHGLMENGIGDSRTMKKLYE
ncbi:peptidoglycan-binding protein [Salipaludibacillus keqinensis]|nr:peptidoglycan-binding protein [Salipaludibacillus keqinensis]